MKKEFEGNHYIHLEMLHIEPYYHTVKLTHILWKEWTYKLRTALSVRQRGATLPPSSCQTLANRAEALWNTNQGTGGKSVYM